MAGIPTAPETVPPDQMILRLHGLHTLPRPRPPRLDQVRRIGRAWCGLEQSPLQMDMWLQLVRRERRQG
jgi:hypothetical protein